jgi:protein-tyrosine phosphatase
MFEFLFSKKKTADVFPNYPPFEAIEIDIHSHLIPGIDDGSPDVYTSVDMIKEMRHLGFKKIVTTPHISELYPNTSDSILDGLIQLKRELKNQKIDMEVSVAAEYMINDVFEEMIQANTPLLTLPQNHILVEMPHFSEPVNLFKVLSLLTAKGYTPVLAHPERYRHYNGNILQYERLKNYGCRFQVNILSLVGYYGQTVCDCAWVLLNNRMVEFVGSDLHHHRHLAAFNNNMTTETQHLLNNYPFQNRRLFKSLKILPEMKVMNYEL